jgi:catechol 2,3-dioxygenase-like lactoylglutathione lyase family enzyme
LALRTPVELAILGPSPNQDAAMTHPPISDSIVFTYTDDLPASSRFFREILELDFVVDQGQCHIFRMSPTSYIGVCSIPGRPRATVGVTITIVTPDVDGWHNFLTAKGLVYDVAPRTSERFQVYSSLFIDPNGYRIEIQNFLDPDWRKSIASGQSAKG